MYSLGLENKQKGHVNEAKQYVSKGESDIPNILWFILVKASRHYSSPILKISIQFPASNKGSISHIVSQQLAKLAYTCTLQVAFDL